jgi:hypothetical protein
MALLIASLAVPDLWRGSFIPEEGITKYPGRSHSLTGWPLQGEGVAAPRRAQSVGLPEMRILLPLVAAVADPMSASAPPIRT